MSTDQPGNKLAKTALTNAPLTGTVGPLARTITHAYA
jgi:hypothetical protein